MQKDKILIIIPARGGSKGIKNKNIRNFAGKPLIAHAVLQAKKLKGANFRILVSTEDKNIANIAKKYGAEVPFFRPQNLARDTSLVVDAVLYTLYKLNRDEGYRPNYIMLLQTTSPLRELGDIYACLDRIITDNNTDAVITVCPTHSLLYHLTSRRKLQLVNKTSNKKFSHKGTIKGFQRQVFPPAYKLNGCFVYIIKYKTLLEEKTFQPEQTRAIVVDAWRSIDLDTPEDFVTAELIYKHKRTIKNKLDEFK